MPRTKAELEDEIARLRGENETLRYKVRLMVEAQRHGADAAIAQSQSIRCLLDALGIDLMPTTLND